MAKFDLNKVIGEMQTLGVEDYEITTTGKFKKASCSCGGMTVYFTVNNCFVVYNNVTDSYVDYDELAAYCKSHHVKYDNLCNTGDGIELLAFDMMDIDYEDCTSPENCAAQPIIDDGINGFDAEFDDDDVEKLISIMGYIFYTFTEIQTM